MEVSLKSLQREVRYCHKMLAEHPETKDFWKGYLFAVKNMICEIIG